MIRILVDSSSDYTMEEIKENGFGFAPLTISIAGKDYKGGIELGADQFYEIMRESGEFPKTSQPSPQDFLDIFKDAKEQEDEVICITLSSALSGTHQSAVLAKNMSGYEKIYIVDSLSAAHGIRILAEHAKRRIQEGVAAVDIAAELETLKGRIRILAMIDTMEYLYRGGRVSKAAAAIGEVAKIKPLITVTQEGAVSVWGKALGKNKAINSIFKQIEESGIDYDYPVYTLYTYGTQNSDVFDAKLEKEGYQKTSRVQIGATIGAHIGPGAFGIIYIAKN